MDEWVNRHLTQEARALKLSFVTESEKRGKEDRRREGRGGRETWPWLKEEVFIVRHLIGRNLARC